MVVDIYEPGSWFWPDDLELEKSEDAPKESGKILPTIMEKYHKNDLGHSGRQKNPVITPARWYYSPKEEIEIDEFPVTGGMWPDAAKLTKIPEGIPTRKISRAVDLVDRNYGR